MNLAPEDVEAAFIAAIRPAVGVPTSTKVPNPRPARHVKVSRAGGNRANLVQERPLLIIEAWGPDSVAAFNLAKEAWRALDNADGTVVAGVALDFPRDALSSPINMPDPDTASPRYQFTATPYARLHEGAAS